MHGVPDFIDREHAFNVWLSRGIHVMAITLFVLVILMQQFLRSVTETTLTEPPESIKTSEEITEPGIEAMVLESKVAVKAKAAGLVSEENSWSDILKSLDHRAATRTQRLRVAIVAGELMGKVEATNRLRALQRELGENSDLRVDADYLIQIYDKGRRSVPPAVLDVLVERHGWFGSLAAGFGAMAGDAYRDQAVDGMDRINLAQVCQGLIHLAFFFAAVTASLILVARWRRGELESNFGGTVFKPEIYLEMFAAFLLLFLILVWCQVMTLWLTGTASVVALAVESMLLWLAPICFVWPLLRGVKWVLVAEDLGWHRGEGFLVEVRWGVFMFFASMPVGFIVSLVMAMIAAAVGSDDAEPHVQGFPTFQPPLSGSWIPMVLGLLSAVVWAPIVEETLFRGALYRFLRTRIGVVAAVLLSAAVFGAIHPYGGTGLVHVAVLGVLFACLREWRGSLIAPVVAHALHNGSIELFNFWTVLAID